MSTIREELAAAAERAENAATSGNDVLPMLAYVTGVLRMAAAAWPDNEPRPQVEHRPADGPPRVPIRPASVGGTEHLPATSGIGPWSTTGSGERRVEVPADLYHAAYAVAAEWAGTARSEVDGAGDDLLDALDALARVTPDAASGRLAGPRP